MTTTETEPADIRTRVLDLLHAQFGDTDPFDDDVEFPRSLGDRFDSLGALEFVTGVEREFGIEVDFVGHDVRYVFSTVGRVVGFVRDRLEDRETLGGTP